jgi:hypothetical protein
MNSIFDLKAGHLYKVKHLETWIAIVDKVELETNIKNQILSFSEKKCSWFLIQ